MTLWNVGLVTVSASRVPKNSRLRLPSVSVIHRTKCSRAIRSLG